jgi:class 3 adenylate cyclase
LWKRYEVTDQQAVAEVRSVMYRMAERYGARDVDGVMALFVEEDPVNIGTGADEARLGSAEVRKQIARDLAEVEAVSMGMDHLKVKVYGDAAFAYSEVVFSATVEGELLSYPARTTVGLTRTDLGWRIAQIHTSFPYDAQMAGRSWPVQLTRTLTDLLASMDSEAGSRVLGDVTLGTATLLFTDVVDSTRLSQSLGDQRWSALITEHFNVTDAIVESEGGSVVKTLGDGGMYVFSSATASLAASIRIQGEATTLGNQVLHVRAGVHTGDVIHGENDYLGLTVNKAARVAAAAEGDQVLVSSSTVESVNGSKFEFGDPITVDLKGIEGTHTLRPLLWNGGT